LALDRLRTCGTGPAAPRRQIVRVVLGLHRSLLSVLSRRRTALAFYGSAGTRGPLPPWSPARQPVRLHLRGWYIMVRGRRLRRPTPTLPDQVGHQACGVAPRMAVERPAAAMSSRPLRRVVGTRMVLFCAERVSSTRTSSSLSRQASGVRAAAASTSLAAMCTC